MILYIYEHCPYCVKARMIFGLKKQKIKIKTLLNDDEKTPHSMIGAKMVPILEYESGQFMPESLDIINFIDKKYPPQQVQSTESSKLLNWINKNNLLCYSLAMPRWVQAPLEEFSTSSAKTYFENKKTAYIGSFKKRLDDSSLLIEQMEKELESLENVLKEESLFFEEKISLNDFHLFAFLRSLSIVKDLSFPEKTLSYMKNLSKVCQIPLHLEIAS